MSIKSLNLNTKLANAAEIKPMYATTIKSSKGDDIVCADPNKTRGMLALMNLGAVNGGAACHWGGPAAMMEMMSAIHSYMFKSADWYNQYNFVNDIGHAENGVYSLRANLGFAGLDLTALKGFRSISSKLTGHGESHLYPEGVLLSNGPLGSSLPQAQGLAHADKLAGNARVTIATMSDGAAMEGEAKESFAAIPGLRSKGIINPFILVISDNNTKLSGRITEDSFDMTKTFESFSTLGWETIKVENGNNLEACYHAIEKANELATKNKPVFIWLKTVKGYGVKKTEESKSGGHGFPLKAYSEEIHDFLSEVCHNDVPSEFTDWANELTQKPQVSASSSSVKKEKAQAGFARAAIKAFKEGYPVLSISSDLQGSTGMAPFHAECSEASLDVGIAESNMVGHAAGLSKAGYIPVVDTFAAFGVTKGNLPFVMASLSDCPMIAVFSHTGFQDAADGASHQSLTYLSALSSIPHTKVIAVSTSEEAETLMYAAIKEIKEKREANKKANTYVFYVGRENFPATIDSESKPVLGVNQLIKKGSDGVIVSAGPLLFKAIEAADKLASQGKNVSVVNYGQVNAFDTEVIKSALNGSNKVLTVEDHQIVGGLGAQLSHLLHRNNISVRLDSLAVQGVFGQSAYQADDLYSKHGLATDNIVSRFLEL